MKEAATRSSAVDTASSLSRRLAGEIFAQLKDGTISADSTLSERKLAEAFKVSRSPVRGALSILADVGAITRGPANAYVVSPSLPGELPEGLDVDQRETWEDLYYQLAHDHVAGQLGEQHSESDLMRRYNVPRAVVLKALYQATDEGWVARAPGHGWLFLPVLNSPDAHRQSRQFRALIEPAALLLPTFQPDLPLFERLREEQTAIIAGARDQSPADLYTAGSRFHEAIVGCSGNMFLADSLARTNRLRRLVEYPKIALRDDWMARCAQHITIIDLLIKGDTQAASAELRRHLESNRY